LAVCFNNNNDGDRNMNVDIYLEALSDFHKLWEYQNPYCEKLNFEKYSAYKEAALKIVDEIKRGDV
tara:strand:- start:1785 stop:1982 length:198 start_codon:yes stop_codon:yes gene_type:complete